MSTTYIPAPEYVLAMLEDLIDASHPEIRQAGVSILCQMHSSKNGLSHHSWPAFAVVSIVSLKDRAAGMEDARIVIDAERWELETQEGRQAILDHELHHLVPIGQWKKVDVESVSRPGTIEKADQFFSDVDNAGRPKLRMRPHDWELGGFKVIAERHGNAAPEQRAFQQIHEHYGQLLLPLDTSDLILKPTGGFEGRSSGLGLTSASA